MTNQILDTLLPGDLVTITSEDLRKPRTLTVTERTEKYVFVTSGHVRHGHFRGGVLRVDLFGRGVSYQATIQQAPVIVSSLVRKAAAAA